MVQFSNKIDTNILGQNFFGRKLTGPKFSQTKRTWLTHLLSFANLSLTFHKEDNGENDLRIIKGSSLHLIYERCTICRRHSLQPPEKFLTKGRPLSKAAMAKQQIPCIAQIWSFLPTLTQYSKLSQSLSDPFMVS